jgi:hypothetical protein
MIIDGPDQVLVFDWMNPIKMLVSNQPLSDAEVEHTAKSRCTT